MKNTYETSGNSPTAVGINKNKKHYEKLKQEGICVQCGHTKTIEGKVQCESCARAQREQAKAWQDKLRADMRAAYGCVCARCGNADNLEFHHINGDGVDHRKSLGGQGGSWKSWSDLRKKGFPPVIMPLCFWCHKEEHGQTPKSKPPQSERNVSLAERRATR